MDKDYTFTMSLENQERFMNIRRDSSYGDLLKSINERLESTSDKTNFKDQSSSKFVLSLIDKKLMKSTVENFPVDLALDDKNVYQYSKLHQDLRPDLDKVYDIRFVLPLLYHSVSPSLFVDCRDFIARRCLALTLTGISSEDHKMRALCYKILERFYEHLLSALLIDKKLWINFLDLIRNSIPAPNARLRFIITTFLSRIIDVLLHPDKDKLYELVKEFLAGRPRLRLDTIEIYDDLQLCSDVEAYNYNLRWLITLFRDGIQTQDDLRVVSNLNIIPQGMCLYNSELRFERANEALCSMFIRIASIPEGADILVNLYSFLPWLHQVIINHKFQEPDEVKLDKKSENLMSTTKSLSSLVFTLIDTLLISKKVENLNLQRILEMVNVFVTLHDLVILTKNEQILEYYLNYVRKVTKTVRKNKLISDQMAGHIFDVIKAKMPYLA